MGCERLLREVARRGLVNELLVLPHQLPAVLDAVRCVTESRFVLWEGAWQLMQGNPFGLGLNHFKREIGSVSDLREMDAHNHFVLIATETGFIGLAAMLLIIFGLFRLGGKLRREAPEEEAQLLGTSLMFAVIAMALGNVYGSRFLDGDVMGNFWILAALVARYRTLREEGSEEGSILSVDGPQGDATRLHAGAPFGTSAGPAHSQFAVADMSSRPYNPTPMKRGSRD